MTQTPSAPWWRTAVVYQIYPRSFSGGNGDGIGDLAGLRSRIPYLAALGVDAIWISPWYPSPMADGGYDVADYRDIDPTYGTLAEAEDVLETAHRFGLYVLIDLVPNHTSSAHPWFVDALDESPGARDRYWFRPGRGPKGELPPNDWASVFGGSAWTRVPDGQWYLHFFAPGQPDLNWQNLQVRREFEDTLRFWFDLGIDGFRIDVAHGMAKDPALPDAGPRPPAGLSSITDHPGWDQDGVHEVFRDWRNIAEGYTPPRIFVAEAWVADNERLARYLRPDGLHTAFQFDLTRAPWRAGQLRDIIDDAVAQAVSVGAPPTWVLSNHDLTRVVTRYARSQPDHPVESHWERTRWAIEPADLALGRRRARAAALLQFALPGTAYLYQGEELGLEEIEDLPGEVRQDPAWAQSGHTDIGRDGCRIPLPWFGDSAPYGFSPPDAPAPPWLPQPPHWGSRTVAAQRPDPDSFLCFYRTALAQRRIHWAADESTLEWLATAPGVLAFARGSAQCWLNLTPDPIDLPTSARLITASQPGVHRTLPSDTAAWLTTDTAGQPHQEPIRPAEKGTPP
ncbi:glycoside hydrolase family 13 protein [Nocardia crassostreae]|uniref:glycoside hydrolase family 13 protein n=1 Tax=Nocardia crassostreae TaxID=53428 RepID=UPI000831EC67|nr:glycoside hydrolase family 13 protein [Nocardia crassostreae]